MLSARKTFKPELAIKKKNISIYFKQFFSPHLPFSLLLLLFYLLLHYIGFYLDTNFPRRHVLFDMTMEACFEIAIFQPLCCYYYYLKSKRAEEEPQELNYASSYNHLLNRFAFKINIFNIFNNFNLIF